MEHVPNGIYTPTPYSKLQILKISQWSSHKYTIVTQYPVELQILKFIITQEKLKE
jgi:hypothetical protein